MASSPQVNSSLKGAGYELGSITIAGNWKQFKGYVKEKWGKLTDDDLDVIEGKKDQLVGRLQERYGYSKEQAEKELKNWD